MFPNVRVMIVAMCASLAAIGCGMGLFAAFRVNNEPLSRLQTGNPPTQLVLAYGAVASAADAALAPFDLRFPVNAPPARGAAVVVPIAKPDNAKLDDAEPDGRHGETPSAAAPSAMTPAAAPVSPDRMAIQSEPPAAATVAAPLAPASLDDSLAVTTPSGDNPESSNNGDQRGPAAPPAVSVNEDKQGDKQGALGSEPPAGPKSNPVSEPPVASAATGSVSAVRDNPAGREPSADAKHAALESSAAKSLEVKNSERHSARPKSKARVVRRSTLRSTKIRTARKATAGYTQPAATGYMPSSAQNYSATPMFQSTQQLSAPVPTARQPHGAKRGVAAKRIRLKKSTPQSTAAQPITLSDFGAGAPN